MIIVFAVAFLESCKGMAPIYLANLPILSNVPPYQEIREALMMAWRERKVTSCFEKSSQMAFEWFFKHRDHYLNLPNAIIIILSAWDSLKQLSVSNQKPLHSQKPSKSKAAGKKNMKISSFLICSKLILKASFSKKKEVTDESNTTNKKVKPSQVRFNAGEVIIHSGKLLTVIFGITTLL